jgi:CBS domain containing-hemolysin-like protein
MASLDRIPEVGDEIEVSGHTLRVEQLDGRRVEAVRLLLAASPDGEEPAPHTASVGESDPGVGPTR